MTDLQALYMAFFLFSCQEAKVQRQVELRAQRFRFRNSSEMD